MRVSIVIVSWNVRKDLNLCLRSIFSNPPEGEVEILVVDNHSSDDTVGYISREFPHVRLICNSENLGFAAANNVGIKEAKGKYLFLLNPDTEVFPGSIDKLLNFLENHPDIGICGAKLLNKDGSVQASVRGFPTFRAALYSYTILRYLRLFRKQYKQWISKDQDSTRPRSVEQLMGAAVLIPREIIEKVGLFDESFFMYYEEVDLCYRIQKAGYKIFYFPESVIMHRGGSSSGQVPDKVHYMRLCSLLHFFRKYRNSVACFLFSVFLKAGLLIKYWLDIAWCALLVVLGLITLDNRRVTKNHRRMASLFRFYVYYYPKLLLK